MFTPAVPPDTRSIMREVALTYRRVGRAGRAAGLLPSRYEPAATAAAIDAYQRLDPDAPRSRLEASKTALLMIASAISADIEWFWRGPDA